MNDHIEVLRGLVEEIRMYAGDEIEGSKLERLAFSWSNRLDAALAALSAQAEADPEPPSNEVWPPDGAVWLALVATDAPANPKLMQYAWGRSSLSTGQMAEAYQCIVSAAQECGQVYRLPVTAPQQPEAHPDDAAVDAFAAAMKAKLAEARAKGRGGWRDKSDCPQQRLSDMLRSHVEKGDPRDVANFACFLWNRGEGILPAAQAEAQADDEWRRAERIACTDDVEDVLRDFAHDPTGNNGVMVVREVLRAIAPPPSAVPEGIPGELVEMGDDEEGNPRLVIATTREAIKAFGPNLLFKRVTVAAAPGPKEGV